MQSDVIFNAKLGSLRKGFKKEIDFTFIRAPHKVPPQNKTDQEDENGVREILIKKEYKIFYPVKKLHHNLISTNDIAMYEL